MKTKRFTQAGHLLTELVVGFLPVLVIWLPAFVVARLLATPYDVLASTSIIALAVMFAPWSPWSVLPNARARRVRAGLHSRPAR